MASNSLDYEAQQGTRQRNSWDYGQQFTYYLFREEVQIRTLESGINVLRGTLIGGSRKDLLPFLGGGSFFGSGFFWGFSFFQSILQVFGPHLDTDKGNVVLGPVLFEVFHFLEAMVIHWPNRLVVPVFLLLFLSTRLE